ncbi:hypothetical protein [Sphingobium sp. B8D3D]|nr:hypothetical protein [Sphingobium sp. B8D3D]
MALLIAGFIYLGFTAPSSVQPAPADSTNDAIAEDADNGLVEPSAVTPDADATEAQDLSRRGTLPPDFRKYLVERYYSETADGNAQCNGNIWSFEPDGTFEITAVADGEISRGRWRLQGDRLMMSQISITDMDTQAVRSEEDADTKISWHDGILIIGSIALYSCHL